MNVAVVLILLHGLDGAQIGINPEQVTSLRTAKTSGDKLLPEKAQCLVHLTDGHYVTVLESCTAIAKALEEARK